MQNLSSDKRGWTGNWVSMPSFKQHSFLNRYNSLQALHGKGKVRKASGQTDPCGWGFVKQIWPSDHCMWALCGARLPISASVPN